MIKYRSLKQPMHEFSLKAVIPNDIMIASDSNVLHSMQDHQHISKSFLYFMFIVEIVAWELAIALVILLGAQGYVGFDGGTPITATSCSSNYFTNKFSALTPMIEAAFIGSLIGIVTLTSAFVIMLVWVVRVCKDARPTAAITRQTKFVLYLLANITILAEIPSCGYYLAYIVELNGCTSTYNSTQIIVIFVIAALLLVFAILFFILSLNVILKKDPDYNYVDATGQPTEPREAHADQTYQSFQRKSPYVSRSPQRQGRKYEDTKQNIFQPDRNDNARRRDNRSPDYDERNRNNSNKPSAQQNLPPSRQSGFEGQGYARSAQKAEGEGQKRPGRKINQDEDDFQAQHNRFMKKYQGGSILQMRGVEEKSPSKKNFNDNFAEPQDYRRRRGNPPSRIDREGVLISHIRGKYGN